MDKVAELVREAIGSPILLVGIGGSGFLVFFGPEELRQILGFNSIPSEWKWVVGIATTIFLFAGIYRLIEQLLSWLLRKQRLKNAIEHLSTLGDDEFERLVVCVEMNSRATSFDKREPEGAALVKMGLLETTTNDPTSLDHAFLIPKKVWNVLIGQREQMLERLQEIRADRERKERERHARQREIQERNDPRNMFRRDRW
jgi:hypothetical protein